MKQSEFRAALNTAFLFIPMDLAKPEERSGSAREMSCEEFGDYWKKAVSGFWQMNGKITVTFTVISQTR